MKRFDRRTFLTASAVGGAALVVPVRFATAAAESAALRDEDGFIAIDQEGNIVLCLPKTEMGQGVHTAIPLLAAEELEVDPLSIEVVLPPGDADLFGGVNQSTGGSSSMQDVWLPVRQAAANMRAALVSAAALRWHADPEQCFAREGTVWREGDLLAVPYKDVVADAANAPLPTGTPLKTPDSFTRIGRDTRRLDSRAKVSGRAVFGIDVTIPGMKVGAIRNCPYLGGEVASLNEQAAMEVSDVLQVVRLSDAVVVIADNFWSATKALDALDIVWSEGPDAELEQARIVRAYYDMLDTSGSTIAGRNSETAASMPLDHELENVVRTYEQPFLAHAPMEPGNCVLHLTNSSLEIWTGTQVPSEARAAAAAAAGLPVERVTLNTCFMGGGFGRRLETDYITRAVEVAKQVDHPLKLIWSRQEDIRSGYYRPFYVDRIEAGIGSDGKPARWKHKIVGSSIIARIYPDAYAGIDFDAVEGAVETPYALPNHEVEYVRHETAMATSWWRGVGGARSAFVVESFIDELAFRAGADPIEFRLGMATDARARAVLELAASAAGWENELPARRARGVALIHLWKTFMAQVVEVETVSDQDYRVTNVTAAVDCGTPINPLGIKAQIEGGIIFGLSAAMFGEITVGGGQIKQSNFHDYRVLRHNEMPQIDIRIVDSEAPIGGIGEPPVATVMPALANAVFKLTGKRCYKLPIVRGLSET